MVRTLGHLGQKRGVADTIIVPFQAYKFGKVMYAFALEPVNAAVDLWHSLKQPLKRPATYW